MSIDVKVLERHGLTGWFFVPGAFLVLGGSLRPANPKQTC